MNAEACFWCIRCFLQGTAAEASPVIPISAQLKYNIDVVCEYIVNKIPIPERNFVSPPSMIVIRSFDVNKPGYEVDNVCGGVAGGSILKVPFFLSLVSAVGFFFISASLLDYRWSWCIIRTFKVCNILWAGMHRCSGRVVESSYFSYIVSTGSNPVHSTLLCIDI